MKAKTNNTNKKLLKETMLYQSPSHGLPSTKHANCAFFRFQIIYWWSGEDDGVNR